MIQIRTEQLTRHTLGTYPSFPLHGPSPLVRADNNNSYFINIGTNYFEEISSIKGSTVVIPLSIMHPSYKI